MTSVSGGSIGYFSPLGFSQGANVNILSNGVLGGGFRGYVPQPLINTNNDSNFSDTRFVLKNAWNTRYARAETLPRSICTPFRAVNNSGDLLSRLNYSCGGACQTFQSRPNLRGLKNHFGHIQSLCDETNIPPSACNVRYVYDSSDYIRYSREKAINKNYNDLSYGGNQSSASQSAIRAIRRY
jgi:hypothetical protein